MNNVRRSKPLLIDSNTRAKIYRCYDIQKYLLKEFTELDAVHANNGLPHPRYLADAIFKLHEETMPIETIRDYIYRSNRFNVEYMFIWLTGDEKIYSLELFESSMLL